MNYNAWPKPEVTEIGGRRTEKEKQTSLDGRFSKALDDDFKKIYAEIEDLDVYL